MPFFEVLGSDTRTGHPRSLHISARSGEEAVFSAADQGLTQIKLRPITDREVLMMDFKCFLNAGSGVPIHAPRRRAVHAATMSVPRSLLLEHPILTLTVAMLLALTLNRMIDALPALF